MEGLEAEAPIVTSRAVNKDQGIFVATHRHAVTKGDINVYDI